MILEDEQATAALAKKVAAVSRAGDIIALAGGVGAGKTSFARFFLEAHGHDGEVPSPTFSIIQPYQHLDPPVWHADLYRIEDPEELAEIGLDELGDEAILLVEWPERAGRSTFQGALRLTFEILEEGRRRLTAEVPAAWEDRWPQQ